MASNSFGTLFRVTTWGESHGPSIGCVIDGCPSNISLTKQEIQRFLDWRAPGRNSFVSERKEEDQVEIVSGVFENKTTGAPISLLINNKDQKSLHYEGMKGLLRPGHANYTYLQKYGIFDYRGGGRASARETAARVAAGAVAHKLLEYFGIRIVAHLQSIGTIQAKAAGNYTFDEVMAQSLFCPDAEAVRQMEERLSLLKQEGDSIGGSVRVMIHGCPVGLGDPMYEKLQAKLAFAMMSIQAAKGFEIGDDTSMMTGSEYNDAFIKVGDSIQTKTNHAGGLLGGITNGQPLVCTISFKPTSSIRKSQPTVDLQGKSVTFSQPPEARHDPCVAIRAVPVCLAMTQLVLADAILMSQIDNISDFV